MSEIKSINSNAGYTHATVGNPSAFTGKTFLKDTLGLTSCEISFGSLGAGEAVPFFHDHKENEEIYIVLSGTGRFQVDGETFDIEAFDMETAAIAHDKFHSLVDLILREI